MKFNHDEDAIDQQLTALAKKAYQEMMDDINKKKINSEDIPSTMAALRVGKKVYFSSSLRGQNFLVLPKQVDNYVQPGVSAQVRLAIERCQEAYGGNTHRFEMHCAEPLAIQAFLVNNIGVAMKNQATISTYGAVNKQGKAGVMGPCYDQGVKRGCLTFLEEVGVKTIGKNNDPDPGPPTIDPTPPPLEHCLWKHQ